MSTKEKTIQTQTFRQVACILGLWTLLLALPGCGGGATKNPIVPVEGKIAFANGKKLPLGTRLLFNPTEGRVGAAIGTTTEDGSFQTVHVNGAAGAEEGKYTVQLLPPEGDSSNFFQMVPKAYHEGAALFAEIKPGMPPLDFKVPAAR